MIPQGAFVIDMSGNDRKTRSDYRALSSAEVCRLIDEAGRRLWAAQSEDDQFDAEFALQELRAVLHERR